MMMWQITKIIIVIELVIGMVDASGLFTQHFVQVNQGTGDGAVQYAVGDLNSLVQNAQGAVGQDWFTQGVGLVFASFMWMLTVIKAVVFILPTLVERFHIPLEFAVVMQGMIYLEYGWGFAQWRAQRPGRSYE